MAMTSFSSRSPTRMPASNSGCDDVSQRIIDDDVEHDFWMLLMKATQARGDNAACRQAEGVDRSVPAILLDSSTVSATAASSSCSIGLMRWYKRAPVGVGATLRVVRFSKRTSSRASNCRIVWLSAEADRPRWPGADKACVLDNRRERLEFGKF